MTGIDKNKIMAICMALLTVFGTGLVSASEIYVSPSGNDAYPGSKDKPFRTISRAKSEVRDRIREGLEEDLSIYLREGNYNLQETLVFGLEDYSPNHDITYSAYNGEEVEIGSGIPVVGWKKVSDFPEYIPETAMGNLWEAPLPEDLGCIRVLYDNGSMLSRARSDHWSPVPPPPESEVRLADSRNVYYNSDRYRLRMIRYNNQELRDWENISDIECVFNPVPWNLMVIPLESVDTETRTGWLAYEANSQPGTKDPDHAPAFICIENAIDYLDSPGEWCVNTKTRKIYYWPASGDPDGNIMAPGLVELVRVEGNIRYHQSSDIPVRNLHFKGLTFTCTDRATWYPNRKGWGIQHDWDTFDHANAMFRFRGAEDCSVQECRFTRGGGSAIRMDLHAQGILVKNNLIDYVGHMGILLCGYGPGTKDVNRNNTIHNNIIHHCGELIWHGHAIFVWQSGHNEISNNWIHDVPRKAIGICGVRSQILMKPDCDFDEASKTIRWNEIKSVVDSSLSPQERHFPFLHARENIVRDNKATRTMLKLSDGSTINISGAGAGNIIEHNFLFDLPYTGFRTDDWQDETYIRNNIVWNCGGSAYIFKGHNYLQNNIAVNASKAVHMRAFPQQTFKPGAVIKNNIFLSSSENFIVYKPTGWPKKMILNKPGKEMMPYEYEVDNNVYWYPGAQKFLEEQKKHGIEQNTLAKNPGFTDPENGDFSLEKDSPALKLGFEPFDTSEDSFGCNVNYPEKFWKLDMESQGESNFGSL